MKSGDDNTNEKYFQIEYIWHTFLIKQKKEERDYIEGDIDIY